MKKKTKMEQVGYGAVMALFGLIKLSLLAFAFVGKVLAMMVVPPAAAAVSRLASKQPTQVNRGPGQQSAAPAKIQIQLAAETPPVERDTGPDTIIHTSQYEAADRIVGIRLDPPVGVINLRVYNRARLVKRDLIVNEPVLKALMKGSRHNFPDVKFDPIEGLDAIKDETVELAEKLINDLGNRSVKAKKPRKDDFPRAKPAAAPAPATAPAKEAPKVEPAKEAPKAEPARAPVQAQAPVASPKPSVDAKTVTPTIKTGYTYVGQLRRAGTQIQRPLGRAPYEVFEATLLLDNGAELALRGGELERELTAAGCQIGQKVAITPMGKLPVHLADGGEGKKNLYRVENLARK